MNYHKEYKVTVPEGKSGDWEVKRFTVSEEDDKFERMRAVISFGSRGRFVPAGTYTSLTRNSTMVMSDTPDEIRDHLAPIQKAKNNCLINGLGLGVVLQAMLEKEEVGHVWVVEISPRVIALVGNHYQKRYGDRLTIVQADALEYKPPKGIRFSVVWNDIWDNICEDNLPDMKKLHRKYGRCCDWQGSWCREWIDKNYRNRW